MVCLPQPVTILSLIGALIYAFVILATARAARRALHVNGERWHAVAWIALAALFSALLVARLLNAEELIRAFLREALEVSGSYEARRDIQRPVAAIALSVFGVIGFGAVYLIADSFGRRRDLMAGIAVAAGAALACLFALRIVSLHFIDGFLYGPLKLNWIGDLGASLTVCAAAVAYSRDAMGCAAAR